MESTDVTAKKHTLLHILLWVLLVSVLFYTLHSYFEYREQLLDERLEMLGCQFYSHSDFRQI